MFSTPLLELVFHAARVHRMYNDPQMVRAGLSQRAPLPATQGLCLSPPSRV